MAILTANNQSLTEITALPSVITTGSMVLLETETASSSSTLDFTSGIDSTYDEYVFKFYDIHPSHASTDFEFNGSIDAGSNYNVTKTTTFVYCLHYESDAAVVVDYNGAADIAQGTGYQRICDNLSTANDADVSGMFKLFNPSSTTFVKHFMSNVQSSRADVIAENVLMAGYANTTSAVDAIQFKMSSGNIDAGDIKLYGIKDS